ncbi:MAG: hypothetical protein H0X14_12445 [Acidobacteria bacterium]|nr:hypothetical protein [Acidobacteriota bacterium]
MRVFRINKLFEFNLRFLLNDETHAEATIQQTRRVTYNSADSTSVPSIVQLSFGAAFV